MLAEVILFLHCLFNAIVVLGSVSSVLSQQTGWDERLLNNLHVKH